MPPVASSLTITGVIWACLSMISAILSATGFYMPYWMKGTLSDGTDVSFASFRRCNYPRLTAEGKLEMIHECGRYTSFLDIPSTSWQVTTITVGLGAAVSLLVAFTALSACCLADVITKTTARILGLIQLIAALLIATGCCIYPNGWSSREIRDVCGPDSEAYRLGTCQISWSLYLLCTAVGILLLCVILSLKASHVKPNSFRI
ncbi:LHFPL tetraspan subfamily member 6 protein-like [Argiope bruennichi]|uniref:LHFPL tetraspan subfamily member 6 protein-like n=1 Tax=Argiope bruennichi TaxID=94029 RepID=UPI0024947B5B|nr:LHFPL tetraspan subfamily member 6 protein-like [Argiope bruennichi]